MFEEHPDTNTPHDDTVVWRYLTLEKLLALISSRQLHFNRLDRFQDSWEGAWPRPNLDSLRSSMEVHHSREEIDNQVRALAKLGNACFVNCWHASNHESAALWDLYSGKAGLAIKSTIRAIKSGLTSPDKLYIGRVEYIDHGIYSGMPFNVMGPAFLKRKSFEHEREVRLLILKYPTTDLTVSKFDWSNQPTRLSVDVQLPRLIDTIFISPTSPDWLVPAIRTLLDKFDLEPVLLQKSSLYDEWLH